MTLTEIYGESNVLREWERERKKRSNQIELKNLHFIFLNRCTIDYNQSHIDWFECWVVLLCDHFAHAAKAKLLSLAIWCMLSSYWKKKQSFTLSIFISVSIKSRMNALYWYVGCCLLTADEIKKNKNTIY